MNGCATTVDLSSVLIEPAHPSEVQLAIQRLVSNSIPGLSQIDAVISLLVHFSPLEEFVTKPFVGDWRAMEHAAVAWPKCGTAVTILNDHVDKVRNELGDGWQGAAADEFSCCQNKLSKLLENLPFQCEQAGVMLTELAAFAKGIIEFIGEVIQGIISYGLSLLADTAVPVVGWTKAVKDAASAVISITSWIKKIIDLFNKFIGFQEAVAAIYSGIAGMYSSVRQALTALSQTMTVISDVAGLVNSATGLVKDKKPAT